MIARTADEVKARLHMIERVTERLQEITESREPRKELRAYLDELEGEWRSLLYVEGAEL